MGLLRLIAISVLVYLLYKAIQYITGRGRFLIKGNKPKTDKQHQSEMMVACEHCDIRLPKEKATEHKGKWFCCQAHLKANENSKPDDN